MGIPRRDWQQGISRVFEEKHLEIRPMTMQDYAATYSLWRRSDGVALTGADSEVNIRRYLERNPGLSFVAIYRRELVGAVLGGHDGRRGYIHHLAVDTPVQRHGIASTLVDRCIAAMRELGLQKAHCFVFEENQDAGFWKATGWLDRADLRMLSRNLQPKDPAAKAGE